MEKYLIHHGILGQKWGIRRYQNTDGSLTEVGKKRYGDTYGPYSSLSKQMQKDAKEADKEDIRRMTDAATKAGKDGKASPSEKMMSQASNITGEMKNITKTIAPKNNTTSEKAKSMSDQELRDAINRIDLERKYDSLTRKEIESGYDKTMKVLSITGSVIGIGAGIAGIATAWNTINQARVKE